MYEKVLWIFKITPRKYNWFWKGKNVTVNKRKTKITSRCKSMLICGKRLLQKFAFDKTYWKIRDHCHYTSKYRCATHLYKDIAEDVETRIDNSNFELDKPSRKGKNKN